MLHRPYRTRPEEPKRLPLLDRVSIKTRCNVPWDEMSGDDASRLCARCGKQVYDLSAMTAEDANALLLTHLEDTSELPCARLRVRKDGRVLTGECASGQEKTHMTRVVGTAIGIAATVIAGSALYDLATRPALGADLPETYAEHDTKVRPTRLTAVEEPQMFLTGELSLDE